MRKNELCTASCMMSDGERMVLARTERYGGAATVIIWDVLGNEPVRRLSYESPVGFVDQISYVGVSRDSRYIVAGYQVSRHAVCTRWRSGTRLDFAIARSRVRLPPVAAVYQRLLSVPSLRGRLMSSSLRATG